MMNPKNIDKSINITLSIGDEVLAGQLGAQIAESRASIDITNKINGEWSESLAGVRSWRIQCNGLYVRSAHTLQLLQQAFAADTELSISFTLDGTTYTGKALLTDFPLNATFGQGLTYRATLLGTGALVS